MSTSGEDACYSIGIRFFIALWLGDVLASIPHVFVLHASPKVGPHSLGAWRLEQGMRASLGLPTRSPLGRGHPAPSDQPRTPRPVWLALCPPQISDPLSSSHTPPEGQLVEFDQEETSLIKRKPLLSSCQVPSINRPIYTIFPQPR